VVVLDSAFRPPEWGSNASYYGIRTFYLNCTPVPDDQFREMFSEQEVNFRELRGTKYFICGQDSIPFDPKARLLFTESGYRVYEAPDPMELYTLVHKAIPFSNKDSFRKELTAGFDRHRAAAIEKSKQQTIPPPVRTMESGGVAAPMFEDLVEPVFRTPNVISVQAYSTKPGLLILNERWSDDWHARVNSRPAKVLRANFTQPAVILPAGRNYVEFEYKPMLFWGLLILQRVTFLLLVLAGAWKLWRAYGGCRPVSVRIGDSPNPEINQAGVMEHHFSHSRTTVTYGMRIGFLSTQASTFVKTFAASWRYCCSVRTFCPRS
jgi:hypothetical protein